MTWTTSNLPDGVAAACERVERADIVSRIWDHDHTVWKSSPDEIANRLGWLHVPETMRPEFPVIARFVDDVQADGFTQVVLFGMGGSSLAPAVLASAFGPQPAGLPLTVVDTTHPAAIQEIADGLDLQRTLFLVATKSGTTTETLSLFRYFYNRSQVAGIEDPGNAFVAITDPESPLADLAAEYGFRATFLNDATIGGRYAALSLFGLIPAALLGIDIDRLLDAAGKFTRAEGLDASLEKNSAARPGVILGELAVAGRDKLTFLVSEPIASFGSWVEQLIAESTGKDGMGILPVVGERLGAPAVYGPDRLFVHLRFGDDDVLDARVDELRTAGHPLIEIEVDDIYDLGREFFRWEFATAVACHILGVNAFDQPDVESAKQLTREKLAEIGEAEGEVATASANLAALPIAAFLSNAESGDYIALHAYLPPGDDLTETLLDLQAVLRDRTHLATTVAYGPRLLHSTGQLHKGDRGNGHFIQLVSEPMCELAIPDVAGESGSSISFADLIAAQAAGDSQALQAAGRRVLTLAVGDDPVAEIQQTLRAL